MNGNRNGSKWSPVFAGVAAAATLVMCILLFISHHEKRPHAGAISRIEYQHDLKQIRDDIREIRNFVIGDK